MALIVLRAGLGLIVAAGLHGACHADTSIAKPESIRPIFFIAKSDSRNEVHYAIALRPDCQISNEPIRVFWLRRADLSEAPRPLNRIEELLVYGVRIAHREPNRVGFTLAADNTRPIVVETLSDNGNCNIRARVRMLGAWVTPKSAYLEITDSRGLIPEIAHIDLHATGADGSTVCERLIALRTPGTRCNAVK